MRNIQSGFTLIELLVVVSIIAVLTTIAFPAYRNYNNEQLVAQSAAQIQSDIRLQTNQSSSGKKSHWYGITFKAANSSFTQDTNAYTLFEMEPKDKADAAQKVICPVNTKDISNGTCASNVQKTNTIKRYATGVILDSIIRYQNDGSVIDTVPFVDIRFTQAPDINQIILSSKGKDTPQVARVELLLKKDTFERSIVIDGGNLCNTPENADQCNGNISGGPQPGRVFIVDKR